MSSLRPLTHWNGSFRSAFLTAPTTQGDDHGPRNAIDYCPSGYSPLPDIRTATNWQNFSRALAAASRIQARVSSPWAACWAIWGGMLGGAGAGGLLSGGIGELLERFQQNGQGDKAESWINQGPNKDVSPPELKQAIGSDVLAQLEEQTGLSQEEILARLSRELPAAVDKYTPEGRMPAA